MLEMKLQRGEIVAEVVVAVVYFDFAVVMMMPMLFLCGSSWSLKM